MTRLEYFVGILSISGCFWILYSFYSAIRVKLFIVKRYEDETDLLNTVFFREHATFTRYLPDFFSSTIYATHLLMHVWGWWLYKNRKPFRDIDNTEIVTQYFSVKEIRKVKRLSISIIIFFLHGAIYYAGSFIWPDIFD